MQNWGLNTYLYGPKDDLKHRLLWREAYSPDEEGENIVIKHSALSTSGDTKIVSTNMNVDSSASSSMKHTGGQTYHMLMIKSPAV